MKLFRYAMLLMAVTMLAGCGAMAADCSSDEVKSTLVKALEERVDNDSWRAELTGVKVRNIVTTESDTKNGNYTCTAQLWHEGFGNGAVTEEIEYDVQKIEDGANGNDFQIAYNQLQFITYSATIGLGNRMRGDSDASAMLSQ